MTGPIHSRGFSLIELLSVILIVAILAAIAIPSYRQYILRSHRVDAVRALHDLASRQERHYFSQHSYAATLDDLGAQAGEAGQYYELDIAEASSTAYTVRASAVGIQLNDERCITLSLDRAGLQRSTGTTNDDPACWGR